MSETVGRRAWLVWGIAIAAYFLAVFNRSSLAVAGLVAADRFGISAAQLATFTTLQLIVYAAMQVPVGILVDRFGPRTVMLTGTLVMAVAQSGFAFAESYSLALVARIGVGIGDSMIFICLLRIIAAWFPLRRIPLMTTLCGTVGQLGAIVAAIPMTWALSNLGWTKAYVGASLAGPVVALVGLFLLHDAPGRPNVRGVSQTLGEILRGLGESWRHPGTRLGFWIHFATPFSANALGLLWGLPFFVRGEGRTDHEAGLLLTLMTLTVMFVGPLLGWAIGREPWHRSTLSLWVIGGEVVVWTAVLLWPGDAPLGLIALLVIVVGTGGPASMIGFDVARTVNPGHRLASASGIVNQGGFIATLLLVLAIGWVLDWRTPGSGSAYTPDAFGWAMSLQYLLWAVGLAQIVRYRRRTRAVISRSSLVTTARTPEA
ncbi:Major Facilitator Superfamily protein [Nocardioides terrae]|uniref:Lysosomal dipeptide transporter MFSD1 n=1 Tax=Nocardioides terrae TaxID=574651 RepID=A0A1I1FJB4_9ACTN|nr:MFS transporter [Nocardioides terrae]SFB99394.1 Major Facilitator Superfamily protein [Nocardioides terrae]